MTMWQEYFARKDKGETYLGQEQHEINKYIILRLEQLQMDVDHLKTLQTDTTEYLVTLTNQLTQPTTQQTVLQPLQQPATPNTPQTGEESSPSPASSHHDLLIQPQRQ